MAHLRPRSRPPEYTHDFYDTYKLAAPVWTPLGHRATEYERSRAHTTYRKYSRVRVLIIAWEDHDSEVSDLEAELQDVSDYFGRYLEVDECEDWRIPIRRNWSKDESQEKVRERLEYFKQKYDGDQDELLVVYYCGHGVKRTHLLGKPTLEWVSGGTDQRVEWNSLQWDCFFTGDNHNVVILDCCHSGLAVNRNVGAPKTSPRKTPPRRPMWRTCRYSTPLMQVKSLDQRESCAWGDGSKTGRRSVSFASSEGRTTQSVAATQTTTCEKCAQDVEDGTTGSQDTLGGTNTARHDIFAACAQDALTFGPAKNSFTDYLVRAGRGFEKAFTFVHWFRETYRLMLSGEAVWAVSPGDKEEEEFSPLPVYKSFGHSKHEIWWEPCARGVEAERMSRSIFLATGRPRSRSRSNHLRGGAGPTDHRSRYPSEGAKSRDGGVGVERRPRSETRSTLPTNGCLRSSRSLDGPVGRTAHTTNHRRRLR